MTDNDNLRRIVENAQAGAHDVTAPIRLLSTTVASSIVMAPVFHLWEQRIPQGFVTLQAGREGIGKSAVAAWLAASVTRGTLPGDAHGTARTVVIVAAEDSWESTVVPRLVGAGADLERVYRVDVTTVHGHDEISLPNDIPALAELVRELRVALIIIDPLIGRLDRKIDTHRDQDTRQALEPLAHLAGETGAAILGLIHVSKANGTDPLTLIMGSRAFAAVARSVLFAIHDPVSEAFILGHQKNNLGPRADPLLYTITGCVVQDHPAKPIVAPRVLWGGVSERTVTEVLAEAGSGVPHTVVAEATSWLRDYLAAGGGIRESREVRKESKAEGFSDATVYRAKDRLHVEIRYTGGLRGGTAWCLPNSQLPDAFASNNPPPPPTENSEK